MCGFFGVLDKNGIPARKEEGIVRAGEKLAHRGPDDKGVYNDGRWGVYFRRLSIIDTSYNGHQPMFSDDGRFVLSFNGEIYNYVELREDLKSLGHAFRTGSDTEVLLKCFRQYGPSCVRHLRGMFAFAVWDKKEGALHLYRDRLGIKPLYMYRGNGFTAVSSEIKSILEYAPESAGIDENTVFRFLAKGWVDDSEDTFYRDIKAVPPATYVRIDDGGIYPEKYWSLSCGEGRNFDADELDGVFLDTVSIHLRSDVPLATTLSGGMDSSSLTAIAARANGTPGGVQAFSVIPPETVDESYWVKKTVDGTGVSHRFLDIDFGDISGTVSEALAVHDEPFQSSSCVYQYLLRKAVAAQNIKVLLVGEGGDEVFGGYRRFLYPFLYMLLRDNRDEDYRDTIDGASDFMGISRERIERGLSAYRDMIAGGESGQENLTPYDVIKPEFTAAHRETAGEKHYPEVDGQSGNYFFAHLMHHLFRRDLPYVLRMEDRNSMAFSVEARVPFLDHRLLETVFRYDYAEFMKHGRNKAMLRKTMEKYLPAEVVGRRSKSPRPGNNAHFIYKALGNEMKEMLGSEAAGLPYLRENSAELFERDGRRYDLPRAETWFRVYVLMKWIERSGVKV